MQKARRGRNARGTVPLLRIVRSDNLRSTFGIKIEVLLAGHSVDRYYCATSRYDCIPGPVLDAVYSRIE